MRLRLHPQRLGREDGERAVIRDLRRKLAQAPGFNVEGWFVPKRVIENRLNVSLGVSSSKVPVWRTNVRLTFLDRAVPS